MSKSVPTPFLTKTYQLVDDHAVDDVVSWNEEGSTFIVWNQTEFARHLLPEYFKHNNFSSFVRQLNTYGFRKVVPDRWEFSNDCFRRGEKNLLREIHRRKMSSETVSPPPAESTANAPPLAVSRSNSGEEQLLSSYSHRNYSTVELIGENERLRKENSHLNLQLSEMKNLCGNIYDLMSNYPSEINHQGSSCCNLHFAQNAIELPENNSGTRLFGVPIGAKRMRGGECNSSDMDFQREGDDKSEALNGSNSSGHQEAFWLRGKFKF